jgi:hypothetical protein
MVNAATLHLKRIKKAAMGRRPKYGDARINVFDNVNLKEWCEYFNVEKDDLITAVLNAGKSPKQVEVFLKKNLRRKDLGLRS